MKRLLATLCLCLSVCGAWSATALEAGDQLNAFTIADQHGKNGHFDEGTRLLLFSRDMSANELAKAAFQPQPVQFLPDAKAMYVIDVSGMPSFVTNNFAIPKMQKYGYRIFLDRDASLTAGLPNQKKSVTLIHLDKLKVTGIEYADTAEALAHAVEAAGH